MAINRLTFSLLIIDVRLFFQCSLLALFSPSLCFSQSHFRLSLSSQSSFSPFVHPPDTDSSQQTYTVRCARCVSCIQFLIFTLVPSLDSCSFPLPLSFPLPASMQCKYFSIYSKVFRHIDIFDESFDRVSIMQIFPTVKYFPTAIDLFAFSEVSGVDNEWHLCCLQLILIEVDSGMKLRKLDRRHQGLLMSEMSRMR